MSVGSWTNRFRKREMALVAVLITLAVAIVVALVLRHGTSGRSLARENACPSTEGPCLGTGKGDVDGDGRSDLVGATLNLGGMDPAANPERQGKLVVHVALATGQVTEYAVRDDATYARAAWVGLSDAVGDGRMDIFVASEGGYESSQMVSMFEYGTWPHARQDGTPTYGGVRGLILRAQFMIDDAYQHKWGFTCKKTPRGGEILEWQVALQDGPSGPWYSGTETTQRVQGNMFHDVGDPRTVSLPVGTESAGRSVKTKPYAGANCPGLVKFPSAPVSSTSPSSSGSSTPSVETSNESRPPDQGTGDVG